MVVGKFGHGRRFRCPCPGCDNVGSWVAEYVDDANAPEAPQAASAPVLTGDARKEAFELATFQEFAVAAQLAVESPENAKPPRPDIRCRIDGAVYWFELGRITDSKLAQVVGNKWPEDPIPFSYEQKEPLARIIAKKAAATYETDGYPVDLVLHFDQQPPDRVALARHLQEYANDLSDLRQRGPFTRMWIYDQWSRSVLWKST